MTYYVCTRIYHIYIHIYTQIFLIWLATYIQLSTFILIPCLSKLSMLMQIIQKNLFFCDFFLGRSSYFLVVGNRWWFRISRVPLTSWGPCNREVVKKPKLKWTHMTCRFIPPNFALVTWFLLCPNFARGGFTPQQQGLSSSCRNAVKPDVSRSWFSSLYKSIVVVVVVAAAAVVVVVVVVPPHPYHWG